MAASKKTAKSSPAETATEGDRVDAFRAAMDALSAEHGFVIRPEIAMVSGHRAYTRDGSPILRLVIAPSAPEATKDA